MSGGLATYRIFLPAGGTRPRSVRGRFLYLKETAFPVVVALRQNQIGDKSGEMYKNEMRKGEKIYADTEFDQIELTNESATDLTVELLAGFGDYGRELPERVSAGDFTRTTKVTLAGTVGGEPLIGEELFRKRLTLRAATGNNVAGVLIAESLAQLVATAGLPLYALESVPYEVKNALFVSGTAGDIIYVVEEIYND